MSKKNLDPIALILMGKGLIARTSPADCAPWRGMENPARPLFNEAQAEENRLLYPHLFGGAR